MRNVGLIGFGFIGQSVYEMIERANIEAQVTWVFNQSQENLCGIPKERCLNSLEELKNNSTDLVIEMAHPDIVRLYGPDILKYSSFMPISLTAFADAELLRKCQQIAKASGTKLYIPHGAAMGLDTIYDSQECWHYIAIKTRKNPGNISKHNSDISDEASIIYNGPTQGICSLYPRNVNTHAAVALAGIGFERTHSMLISDPKCDGVELSIEAKGPDMEVSFRRTSKMKGVSSASMPSSVFSSLKRVIQDEKVLLC